MQNMCSKNPCYKVSKWAVFYSDSICPAYCTRFSADLNCCAGKMAIKSSINMDVPICLSPNQFVSSHGELEKTLQSCGFAKSLLLKEGLLLSGV